MMSIGILFLAIACGFTIFGVFLGGLMFANDRSENDEGR